MRAQGTGVGLPRRGCACSCGGGVLCALGTESRYSLPRLTDGGKQPTNSSSSASDKCTTITYHKL
ncbi:hypothetical protein DPMN_091773 [Dreissena polymorpha]|uniref:Uncharacterized protein n=1 Tax=Dreissena polymorpha TaxID=45954 RepID=A0A9D4R097_DREPO|nr:hypothetical protein DPMN_091773 [Dreissena polymorpha]